MSNKVLILGGYGNFGKRIAELLTRAGVCVIIAGRDREKADALVARLPQGLAEAACFDMTTGLDLALTTLKPRVLIHTAGPFQDADYSVARTALKTGIDYIDLADGRDFVTGFSALDAEARHNTVCLISGASTVPGLSSAVLDQAKMRFSKMERLKFGIAPGQKAERGLATTRGILSYAGKRLKPCAGFPIRYGWQDIYRQPYPGLGQRWMANCEIPDLDLLPPAYGLTSIQFSAGMENPFGHLGLWGLSSLVRLGLPLKLETLAGPLLAMSHILDPFGSADGGMHMEIQGLDHDQRPIQFNWFIVARSGHGPYIPCIPAVWLTQAILDGRLTLKGAMPCLGLVPLQGYLEGLKDFDIEVFETQSRIA